MYFIFISYRRFDIAFRGVLVCHTSIYLVIWYELVVKMNLRYGEKFGSRYHLFFFFLVLIIVISWWNCTFHLKLSGFWNWFLLSQLMFKNLLSFLFTCQDFNENRCCCLACVACPFSVRTFALLHYRGTNLLGGFFEFEWC